MSYTPPTNKLNQTQRKSLGLGDPVKFVRDPQVTPSRTFVNAAMPKGYKLGDGEQRNYLVKA